jgi:hypothetical protein
MAIRFVAGALYPACPTLVEARGDAS